MSPQSDDSDGYDLSKISEHTYYSESEKERADAKKESLSELVETTFVSEENNDEREELVNRLWEKVRSTSLHTSPPLADPPLSHCHHHRGATHLQEPHSPSSLRYSQEEMVSLMDPRSEEEVITRARFLTRLRTLLLDTQRELEELHILHSPSGTTFESIDLIEGDRIILDPDACALLFVFSIWKTRGVPELVAQVNGRWPVMFSFKFCDIIVNSKKLHSSEECTSFCQHFGKEIFGSEEDTMKFLRKHATIVVSLCDSDRILAQAPLRLSSLVGLNQSYQLSLVPLDKNACELVKKLSCSVLVGCCLTNPSQPQFRYSFDPSLDAHRLRREVKEERKRDRKNVYDETRDGSFRNDAALLAGHGFSSLRQVRQRDKRHVSKRTDLEANYKMLAEKNKETLLLLKEKDEKIHHLIGLMADQNKRMDELESRLAAMADEFRISKAQLETDKAKHKTNSMKLYKENQKLHRHVLNLESKLRYFDRSFLPQGAPVDYRQMDLKKLKDFRKWLIQQGSPVDDPAILQLDNHIKNGS